MSKEEPADPVVWHGKYIEVRAAPHGDGTWEYATRTRRISAAVILALTDAREIVLVEQYRPPLGRRSLELPAGLIGDETDGEDALESARRELLEETGFEAANWDHVGEFASSPGMIGETFHLFRATGLVRRNEGGGVEGEGIEVHVVPLGDLHDHVAQTRRRGAMIDTRLIAAMSLV